MTLTGIRCSSTPRHSLVSTGSELVFSPGLKVPQQHPFQSAMADFTDVPPRKLAFYLFTKDVITQEDLEAVKVSASKPDADLEELNMEILEKVYHFLRDNPSMIDGICSALERLSIKQTEKKVIVQKLAEDSKTCKLSHICMHKQSTYNACHIYNFNVT